MSTVGLFLKALLHYWWALMSCAAFTLLGIWATYAEKGREWILWTSVGLSLAFILVATYKVWAKEHGLLLVERGKVESLTAKPNVGVAIHGLYTHIAHGDQVIVILPDVTIANQSHGLRMAVTADLWMLRSARVETWCSPETRPVVRWEQSAHSYKNKLVVLPLNLEPRSPEMGYLAFGHRVGGLGNEPLRDGHGHLKYRIDVRDVHSNAVIFQQEIAVPPNIERGS